jgi:hypothetical protein
MNKEIFNEYIEYLRMVGFFKNNFLDEYKFRNRMYKYIVANKIVDDYVFTDEFQPAANTIAKSIIEENIESTLQSLKKIGLLESVISDDGVEQFKLKQ